MTEKWTDLRQIKFDELEQKKGNFNNKGQNAKVMNGNFIYKGKSLVTQTPWLRSTTGWSIFDGKFGKQYSVLFSMLPIQEGSESNTQMVTDFKTFVKNVDQKHFEFVKEHYEEWVGEPCPPDNVLREYQTSIIKPEDQGYPESYQFNFNDMIQNGKYIGGVLEQSYDADTKQLGNTRKPSNIEKLRKHGRARQEITLKSYYVSIKEIEQMGEVVKQVRFGVNWRVGIILFYNVLNTITDAETLKSYTFGDITVTEPYCPEQLDDIKVEVIEKGKRKVSLPDPDEKSAKKIKAV